MRPEQHEGYLDPAKEAGVDEMSEDGVPRQTSFEQYLNVLMMACAGIEDLYFHVPLVTEIKDRDEFVKAVGYRERVYCYELYHQQRLLLTKQKLHKRGLLLNAETDKSGTVYTKWIGARKPDFILHRPGEGTHNIAILEAKAIVAPIDDIEEDLKKLKDFLNPRTMNYFGAVALIYGEHGDAKIDEITALVKRHFGKYWPARFRALWHRKPRTRPEMWNYKTGTFAPLAV